MKRSLVAKARRHSAKAPGRVRPYLEVLEDRTLLNNRFVVPIGAPVDNATTFGNLQAALTTSGLATGDTIEIEPGSSPGNVVYADFTTAFTGVTKLTIQGNPAVGLAGIPQFTISDATTIAAADTLNLNVANVGLITAGSLTFSGNTNITGSILADVNSGVAIPFILAGSSDNVINSTVVNDIAVGMVVLDVQTPAAGSSNRIGGDTFVSSGGSTKAQLAYFNGYGAAVTDKVAGNTFVAGAGTTVDFAVALQESVTGLTIQNNTFSGPINAAINQAASTPQNLQILENTVNTSGNIGFSLNGGDAGTTTSVTVSDNLLNNGSRGICLAMHVNGGTFNALVQGNDFHNAIGVSIVAGANSIAGVDLGGGSQGSVGGNNFRSFTAAANLSAAAIEPGGTTGTLQAQNNIFAVGDPQTVIWAKSGATVNATALSANAAFVDVLYEDFLKRAGNTTNSSDAGNWIGLLNGGGATPASVASAIIRSAEALGIVVDGLYLKVLGRTSDAAGRAAYVNFLQNGVTIEQAIVGMVNSPEYIALTGSDGGFVESLYVRLLGRTGGSSEVFGWLGMLPNLGRGGIVNAFVSSGEFRTDVVQGLYGSAMAATVSVASLAPDLLHRSASAMEVSGWVNPGIDIATIVLSFASTAEFFTNG